jgi:hypothetical protein
MQRPSRRLPQVRFQIEPLESRSLLSTNYYVAFNPSGFGGRIHTYQIDSFKLEGQGVVKGTGRHMKSLEIQFPVPASGNNQIGDINVGEKVGKVTVEIQKGTAGHVKGKTVPHGTYLEYVCLKSTVSNILISGGGGRPTESVTFSFRTETTVPL